MAHTSPGYTGLAGPTPPDGPTALRWDESARRRRLLEGYWREDLRRRLSEDYGPTRFRRLGVPETTKNLFRSVISQLAILYDREPLIDHPDPAAAELMRELTRKAGLWQLAKTLQQQTLALREGAYRIDVRGTEADAELLIRVVPADLLVAEADPDRPDVPHTVWEYRRRRVAVNGPVDEVRWTRDYVTAQGDGAYRVQDEEGNDITGALGIEIPEKPYENGRGEPILPYVLFHAVRSGDLWDPFRGIELVDGTLTVASLWTQWRHMVRDASWPQRWAVNAAIPGTQKSGETGDAWVETDEGSLLNFVQANPNGGVQIGQFEPGGDPKVLGEAIRAFASDLAADFDISPADIQRLHNERSGYAIEVTREGQRHAQRRYEPQFRRGDLQTLSVIASLWNASQGAQVLPEDGWSIRYLGLPLSMEEKRHMLEQFQQSADLGITSKPQLLAALEGISEEQARERLRSFRQDAAEFPSSVRADNVR